MGKGFSKRSTTVSPSLTLAITAKSNELISQGVDVVSFGVGEPDFNTPQYIIDGAKYALDHGMTKYTASSGTPTLKKTICEKLNRDNGLNYKPNQIVVSNGAKHSLFNALQVLVDEGDEVIILAPYWLTYPELVGICGGKTVVVECLPEDGFVVRPEILRQALNEKTKAIILNSPNNPTGAVYDKNDILAVVEVLKDFPDVWIIADEIYEKLIYDGEHISIASISQQIYDRTIVINGMSKAYAMTGWRIGYAAAPTTQIAKLMDGLQSHETSNPNTIAQYAAQIALNGNGESIDAMKEEFSHRRDLMLALLADIDKITIVKPKGAFYVMVDVSALFDKTFRGEKILSANNFAKLLIESYFVAVIPCEGFGADKFIRLSYATSREKITEGLKRLNDFVKEIK
ncbi:MAG TPA: pyridoxal phosphate-dependent aminotransferase [Clostridia bacterium]|nr:pyridoxal phosphate-dependent aminotransferase [Clostridia bacterium]